MFRSRAEGGVKIAPTEEDKMAPAGFSKEQGEHKAEMGLASASFPREYPNRPDRSS